MSMPCEVNSILKLNPSQGYPEKLLVGSQHQATKEGYRIIPVDVPILLVDRNWNVYADVIIHKLIWEKGYTGVAFEISRIYEKSFKIKE